MKYVGIFYKIKSKLPLSVLKNIYFAFVYRHILYGIEIYANTSSIHLKKLITLNNKLLRILQNKLYKFHLKDLYHNFDTLAIPELHIHQMLILVHKFLHHILLLPTAFANYFTINSAIHLHNTRVRENLHLDYVSTNYGKMTVRYKASKIWNKLPSSLKNFFSVKHFSSKLKEFLQVVDIDSIF